MWSCTCKLILNRSIWIIYLATIQLGTSLVFTFYHQGHWMGPHSNLTHDTSSVLVPPAQSKSNRRDRGKRLRGVDIYLRAEKKKQKVDEHARWWLSAAVFSGQSWSKRGGHAQGLTSHNGSNVYSRQFSFLPTIMREIESQEMFVFLSIRPNNNIIPTGLQKHLSSKDRPEN